MARRTRTDGDEDGLNTDADLLVAHRERQLARLARLRAYAATPPPDPPVDGDDERMAAWLLAAQLEASTQMTIVLQIAIPAVIRLSEIELAKIRQREADARSERTTQGVRSKFFDKVGTAFVEILTDRATVASVITSILTMLGAIAAWYGYHTPG